MHSQVYRSLLAVLPVCYLQVQQQHASECTLQEKNEETKQCLSHQVVDVTEAAGGQLWIPNSGLDSVLA